MRRQRCAAEALRPGGAAWGGGGGGDEFGRREQKVGCGFTGAADSRAQRSNLAFGDTNPSRLSPSCLPPSLPLSLPPSLPAFSPENRRSSLLQAHRNFYEKYSGFLTSLHPHESRTTWDFKGSLQLEELETDKCTGSVVKK